MVVLNRLSSEYREVSRQLAKEKEQKKMELQASDGFVYSRLAYFNLSSASLVHFTILGLYKSVLDWIESEIYVC